VTFAIVDVIFPATFNYFNAFFPVKMCDANIFTEGVRKSKNQPFSIFFLKTADFYHAMVRKILAIEKEIDEILHLQAKIIIRYARKKWSSCVSRQRMTANEKKYYPKWSFTIYLPNSLHDPFFLCYSSATGRIVLPADSTDLDHFQ